MSTTTISIEKSTNGRLSSGGWQQFLYRTFPRASAALLARSFLTPWRRLPRLSGGGARTLSLVVDDTTVTAFVSGTGPLVILCHGWSGSGVQFGRLQQRLLSSGFSVAVFDAPGHGASSGRVANVGQFTRCIEQLARRLGSVHAIVGHSLGGMAAALADTRSVHPQGIVLLAPMPSFDFALDQFQEVAKFDDALRERIAQKVEQVAGIARSEASLDCLLSRAAPSLLVHDARDRRIPVTHSRVLAARFDQLEYVETDGLGHKRLLDDDLVIERVTRFISQLPPCAVSPLDRALAGLERIEF